MWLRIAFVAIWVLVVGFVSWKYLRKWWVQGRKEELEKSQDVKGKVVELKRLQRKYNAVKDVDIIEVKKQKKKVEEILDL